MKTEITSAPARPSLSDIAVEKDLTLVAVEDGDSDYCMDRWRVKFTGDEKNSAMGESMEQAFKNLAMNLSGKHVKFGEKTVLFPHDMID